jgi:hypothetical protein
MMQVANQFVRIFSDDGRGDKDFAEAEERLRQSQSNLLKATDLLKHTAELLSGLLESRENRKH